MKPSSHAESTQSAPTRYAPSVPMSVYRELAAELRTNKAVIDSLNSRNEQLLKHNQRLKREIHHVVQAALTLGQAAGVARPASKDSFSSSLYSEPKESFSEATTPDALASLARTHSRRQKNETQDLSANQSASADEVPTIYEPTVYEPLMPPTQPAAPLATPKAIRNRVPKPIVEGQSVERAGKKQILKSARNVGQPQPSSQSGSPFSAVMPKLFTEQSGEYRSSILEKSDEKEIGGIWLALSIVLIIVTAFGAGFLIMKPLLNER